MSIPLIIHISQWKKTDDHENINLIKKLIFFEYKKKILIVTLSVVLIMLQWYEWNFRFKGMTNT